jgi:hypothetical protein
VYNAQNLVDQHLTLVLLIKGQALSPWEWVLCVWPRFRYRAIPIHLLQQFSYLDPVIAQPILQSTRPSDSSFASVADKF